MTSSAALVRFAAAAVLGAALLAPVATRAQPRTFQAGSLIVPMDTDHQDLGTLEAFGLVYSLIEAGIEVDWCIRPAKAHGDADFVASAVDHLTGAAVSAHGYRGGPFVVSAALAGPALPTVDAWLALHPDVAVHVATDAFDADVARSLVLLPTIGVLVDGMEDWAFDYLNAAGIPDRLGQAWPAAVDGSGAYPAWPDVLDGPEVVGPSALDPRDGALFAPDGGPDYCLLFAGMDVEGLADLDSVMAEIAEFVRTPTAVFAGYRAAVQIESHPSGRFLTSNGIVKGADANGPIDHLVADVPVSQADGEAQGREAEHGSYSLDVASVYYDDTVALASVAGRPVGDSDWLISGRAMADREFGVVTYLGGKGYPTRVPISGNPRTQGVRYFLDAVLESAGLISPTELVLSSSVPATVANGPVTLEVTYLNDGPEVAESLLVRVPIPAGFTLESACCGGVLVGNDVVWSLGDLQAGESGILSLSVSADLLPSTFTTRPRGHFRRECAVALEVGDETSTLVEPDADLDAIPDDRDNCPNTPNSDQADSDGDGAGDACDPCPLDALDDADGDGHCADVDNCPAVSNADQDDADGDGAGDACDPCPLDGLDDSDGDGHCADVDNCPSVSNADQDDADGDGSGDACDPCPLDARDDADADGHCANVDNCPATANPGQVDSDGDGAGNDCDACPFDPDDDGDRDGRCADVDNCPTSWNPRQEDPDGDGAGSACDPCPLDLLDDADADGHCADVDNCPDIANPGQEDPDLDGAGSACDPCPLDASDDSDGDGWCADVDNCPSTANPGQEDEDANGVGDACECGTTYSGPPVEAVVGLRPTPDKRLLWQAMTDADEYVVQRGTLPENGTLVTRPVVYDHACRARVTTAGFVEMESPTIGSSGFGAFYYLVLASNPCGDSASGLGASSFGVPRPVTTCP